MNKERIMTETLAGQIRAIFKAGLAVSSEKISGKHEKTLSTLLDSTLEKQIPKQRKHFTDRHEQPKTICPTCGFEDSLVSTKEFCEKCGQKLFG